MNYERRQYPTLDSILELLSDDDVASVRASEAAASLSDGDEYLDLEQLQHACGGNSGPPTPIWRVIPEKCGARTHVDQDRDVTGGIRCPRRAIGHSRSTAIWRADRRRQPPVSVNDTDFNDESPRRFGSTESHGRPSKRELTALMDAMSRMTRTATYALIGTRVASRVVTQGASWIMRACVPSGEVAHGSSQASGSSPRVLAPAASALVACRSGTRTAPPEATSSAIASTAHRPSGSALPIQLQVSITFQTVRMKTRR